MKTTVQQLSIFLENKKGSLIDIINILKNADIKIIASTVADTTEFGILRIITNDNENAYTLLKNANKSVSKSEVIVIACDSNINSFYNCLEVLNNYEILVEYMYSFSVNDKAYLILNVNNTQKTLMLLEKNNIQTISNDHLSQI